jgi:hypothetical protein
MSRKPLAGQSLSEGKLPTASDGGAVNHGESVAGRRCRHKESHWAHTCSTLPEHSAALPQGRKRRSRPLSPSSSMMRCLWPKRSCGLWINSEAAQRSCWHCYGSETRESSTRPRSQCRASSRHLPRRVQTRWPAMPTSLPTPSADEVGSR